jgi:type II secretory pathway pseudopilin PulG
MFHKMRKPSNPNQTGFTIAELTIATAVFSIVLLTALAGFIQIGHIFYKGITITSTQETANQIYQDISGYFQTASAVSPKLQQNGYSYYCIGGARFTFNTDKALDASAATTHSAGGNFGILKDILPGGAACDAPCDDTNPAPCTGTRFQNPQELLGDKMRVLKFDVNQAGGTGNFYNISMILAYGNDDVLGHGTPDTPENRYCLGGTVDQQFCSIANIDAGVFRGFQ